ncbi:MAG: peptidylprolyl isomerase [Ottowia sp.]|jgi:peptidyl-prolyl cis-trans isomerase SurA|nr:peptidylprolyl isomerase [Ottowia sp.]
MTKTSRPLCLPRATWAALPLLCAALALPAHAQSTDSRKQPSAASKRAAQPAKKPAAKPTGKAAAKPAAKPSVKPAAGPAAASSAPAAASGARSPVANAGPREADYIVAVVNSEPITNNEVRARAARAQQQLTERGATPPPAEELRKEVLERLISERAQLQFARETGIKVEDASLEQAELAIARQNELRSVAELHRRVEESGIAIKDFRDDIRNQVTLARLREREIDPKMKVTDAEVDTFIRQQTGAQAPGQDINLAMILIAVPENATAEERARLQARADEVARRAKAGEDFAKLAAEFSDANNRGSDGGVLGLRPADRYPDLFARATQRTRVGDTVGPLKSDAGFHVLKLLDRKRNNDLPEVRIPQTHVRHILLKVGPTQTERIATERAADMRRRIVAKQASFETLARENSGDESAAEGGDLGWVSPGQFVPEFEQAMNNLDPGQVSPPIVTRFGVHLIRVDERTERTLSSDDQRQMARNMLREKKAQDAFETWAREVRGRAYVEYRDPPK